ncbi:hypothetical protein JQN06_12915 [Bacteroides uniformis]|uniref:Uncharacterized protein n=1 Tax=Bacteroides uniformis TaxID=820 RepID=A0ABS5X6I1_BACUN|nr:hypothetical protein [Phocaeicola dorei]MBT1302922.1 hypothetical protein [Phocaeicola dorei]MBT8727046.1 hypothetical protein [Bacteroides uniformis]
MRLFSCFNAILRLAKASEKYPVNLDEVWMLVYSRKSDAVDALQRDFVENDDYQVLRQNPQNPQGGRPVNEYRLTVPCLEYFIVKKVRSVFEVYRKVFHKAPEMAKQLKQATVKDKIVVADWLTGFLNLNESSKLALAKTIAEPLGLPTPDYTPSKGVLKSAGELLKENECTISAQAFNQKMIEKGYMVELTRPSSKGGVKKFKSIIGDGLNYGENQVNPNNPKSTQPLYYEDKFIELLISLQLKQIA